MKRLARTALVKQLTTLQARIDITSERLCDDVIQRLAPTLGQYVGGTIIDINPGTGLFSSKLHAFLNPRSHILMEPMQKRYHPYLQPLLAAPDSRYLLRDWSNNHYGAAVDYVREGFLPDLHATEGLKQSSPNSNNSVLVIANLAHQKTHKEGDDTSRTANFRSPEEQAFTFAHEARLRSNFFSRGPMRMLMWANDMDKRSLLPRTVGHRTKTSIYLEGYCQVQEIVGSESIADNKGLHRESTLDVQSAQRTAKRMAEMGVSMPPDRIRAETEDKEQLSEISRDWHNELRRLEQGFENQEIPQFVGIPAGPIVPSKKKPKALNFTPEWQKMMKMRRVLQGQNKDIARVDTILEKQAVIDRLDLAANCDRIGKAKQDAMFKDLDAKIGELRDELEYLKETDTRKYLYRDDDRRAFAMSPPLLMWDRRNAEPLQVNAGEYKGSTPPVLLDFQAKAVDDLPLNREQSSVFDFITTELLAGAGRNNVDVLKKAAPGAYDAVVPKVSELRDPRLGGRRDLASVRNRTLTPKMIHALTMVWDKWPFKPSLLELMGSRRGDSSAPGSRQIRMDINL